MPFGALEDLADGWAREPWGWYTKSREYCVRVLSGLNGLVLV